MRHTLLVVLLGACAVEVKTPETELRHRLTDPGHCQRTCPVGEKIEPIEPQATHILEDCCKDLYGIGWASCAWNAGGWRMTREQLMDPSRVFGCGGPEWPDCPIDDGR